MSGAGDRRPIAARELGPVRRVAAWLIGRGASPDFISVMGMGAGVLAGAALAAVAYVPGHAAVLFLGAAVLVQARLMANLLDGMVAIGRGVASPLGELFNEVPDRVSDTAVLVGLGWGSGAPALGMGAALAAMATAYVRAVGRGVTGSSDFRGPMAKQQRMAVVTGVAVWCAVVPGAWAVWVPGAALWVIVVLSVVTVGRRLGGIVRVLR